MSRSIAEGDIPTIGKAIVGVLDLHGIRTAADILRTGPDGLSSLAGVGPKTAALLVQWARREEGLARQEREQREARWREEQRAAEIQMEQLQRAAKNQKWQDTIARFEESLAEALRARGFSVASRGGVGVPERLASSTLGLWQRVRAVLFKAPGVSPPTIPTPPTAPDTTTTTQASLDQYLPALKNALVAVDPYRYKTPDDFFRAGDPGEVADAACRVVPRPLVPSVLDRLIAEWRRQLIH